jgi:protein-S-isoprenylcysteine O-methyltransferase Ste14
VPWVFVLGYLLGAGLQALVPVTLRSSAVSTALQLAGGVLFLAGAVLAGWAWLLFRRARTTTVPGEAARVLVTHGPYRLTRNPMYVGLTIAYLGEAALLAQTWPLAFLLLVLGYINSFVIPVEEATLQDVPGYAEYHPKVRRWL